ncbi:MAG: hypothetical protein ACI909_002564, partial [Planctomycetota bacterium]
EKDFWLVWVLDRLFGHAQLQKILQFKGGTSLSKAYNLIGRFSEDIDLILDWREVTQDDPHHARSKTQQNKFNEATNEQARIYIKEKLLPEITGLLAPLCDCHIEGSDGFIVYVRYPSAFKHVYLRSEILLEIGPLASWLPSALVAIQPYAANYYPQAFTRTECQVPTILARRTFWEKATILHQEAHREKGKPIPSRYSRHYYDLASLARADVRKEALADLALLKDVVDFKQRFYPSAWAKYELATPGSFKLLPPEERFSELEKDYQAMQAMIFDKALSFAEIIESLTKLETDINALARLS